ncbi:MAG: carotenoid oxygenase family protein [Elainellaceae cyanobacterium]
MQSYQLDQETQQPVSPSTSSTSYRLEDWQKGYRSLIKEHDYWIDEVEGQIPPDLQGTLFRNGPGLFEINGQRIQHPFDGDGMISAIRFQDGRAHYRNRYVRTQGYLEEQQAGKILYRGVFGTQKPGGWLANAFNMRLKNIANTNVIYWGDRLLALWEAAEPYRLDPATLETLGIDYLDGLLKPGSAFGAHPRIDPASALDDGEPCLVNFSIKPGLSTTITIYEFNVAGQLVRQHAHTVPGFAFVHDFAITPNYCIFFQAPIRFNPLPYLFGFQGAGQCLQDQPGQSTQVILIPRHGSAPVQFIPVEAGFVFHHANAFEQNGAVYVDSLCYESLTSVDPGEDYLNVRFDQLSPAQLWRFRFDLATQAVERQMIDSRCCEFPALHPRVAGRPYRYLYLGAAHDSEGNAPLQAILKLDWQTGDRQVWSAAPRGFISEPVFVPRSQDPNAAEDDGWLLTMVFNAEREKSELVILNAQNLQPIAKLLLKHHVPYGLHGSFTPHCF